MNTAQKWFESKVSLEGESGEVGAGQPLIADPPTRKYKVTVEKYMYSSGFVEVEAADSDSAIDFVQYKIESGELSMDSIDWGAPIYEEGTFNTSGDCD